MMFRPVEWVLVVLYGSSAHRATYGRLQGTTYTKDYIQLSKRDEFLASAALAFPKESANQSSVPLTFKWPGGSQAGAFVYISSDRPHLKWETIDGAPPPWKMALVTQPSTVESLPGNPSHTNPDEAEKEFAQLISRCGGQPYLVAVKLADEKQVLHLRVYIEHPNSNYAWAATDQLPDAVLQLIGKVTKHEASKASTFESIGAVPSASALGALDAALASDQPEASLLGLHPSLGAEIAKFLKTPGKGLFFDPDRKQDAWLDASAIAQRIQTLGQTQRLSVIAHFAVSVTDSAAEAMGADPEAVEEFSDKIATGQFGVEDVLATLKVRGSAQRAFANAVKANYLYSCAVTGISTRQLLVASHIVPWSDDESIRLDPRNGICLSPIIDRAFELGLIELDANLVVTVRQDRINNDDSLLAYLMQYDGAGLKEPTVDPPNPKYLLRRAELTRKLYGEE